MFPLESRLKDEAHALGFELVGIAPAAEADSFDHLQDWLARGFSGEMNYLDRREEAYRHPASILPEVRSVVMVGMNYKPMGNGERGTGNQEPMGNGEWGMGNQEEGEVRIPALSFPIPHSPFPIGKVARYARGADYHDVLRERLKQLLSWMQTEVPGCRGRAVVDTAPLLERDFARRAGLGWFGKNTMLLNKRLGSYFFLGALLLDCQLTPDEPHKANHCGSCTACLDACPTEAFVGPGLLDARRCISYLTIELRGPVAEELRPRMGDWLFGCDVCQEVCPWNRKAPAGMELALQPCANLESLDPVELLGLSEEDFRRRFRGTALTRPKRAGLLRNAAIVLGNQGDAAALPALRRAEEDTEPIVRGAAQWAIAQIVKREERSE